MYRGRPVPKCTCITGETCNRNADMAIDTEQLLLMRRELVRRSLPDHTQVGKKKENLYKGTVVVLMLLWSSLTQPTIDMSWKGRWGVGILERFWTQIGHDIVPSFSHSLSLKWRLIVQKS